MKLNIDKSDWIKVKLNDVCEWYQKNIPNDEQIDFGINYYVTANHIDSDSIKFERYSELADGQKGPTITKHFEKGDLLLSTRSVALRKAALAPVDGVTGEKLLVLRVKAESALLSELMPFVFQSIDFWEYAQNSASGSVNKFTSWTKIRDYEFLLPPKDQQAQLAKLLWAVDEVIESEKESKGNIAKYLEAVSGRVFSKRVLSFGKELPFKVSSENWRGCHLDELCELITDGAHASPKTVENGNPIGTVENMRESEIDVESCRRIGDSDFEYLKRNNCKPIIGDVLFSKDGTIGKTFVFNQNEDLVLLSSIAIIRTNKEVLIPEYCSLMLESPVFITEIEKRKSGTALKRVVLKDIKKFRVNLPSIKFQREISKYLIALKSNISLLDDKIETSQSLQKSLINQVF